MRSFPDSDDDAPADAGRPVPTVDEVVVMLDSAQGADLSTTIVSLEQLLAELRPAEQMRRQLATVPIPILWAALAARQARGR